MTPGLISEKVVVAKLALLTDMLRGIATLPLATEQVFLADPRMVAAGESFLRRALEALLDLGRHILAKGNAEVVPEYPNLGPALSRQNILSAAIGDRLRRMGGYRSRLVHGYEEVGGAELYRILCGDVADVREAAEALRAWLTANPDRLDGRL
jgi:uncharacterized protein YutE (UPF0331/DUF86 family)